MRERCENEPVDDLVFKSEGSCTSHGSEMRLNTRSILCRQGRTQEVMLRCYDGKLGTRYFFFNT